MESQKYFQHYDDYFWSLTNYVVGSEATEYEMPSGGTIAYREYIIEVLEHLSEESWPPFGALLLAVIATNHNASVDLDAIYKYGKAKEKPSAYPNANLFKTEATVDFLRLLEKLPAAYKTGNKRLLLFQTIFEKCHNRVSKEKAKLYLDEYKFAGKNQIQSIPFNDANFIKDFKTIALLKTKFLSVNSIIEAMENLPEQQLELEEELEQNQVSEKPKDFVEQLIEENKTFQVGSLIKRIWSGLNIPLHHNTPSSQPLGGISDLTNKGDFDKLLISEFANDDLIFMSRLANNEALYIQREIPPEDDKFKRILLMDSSLKNWGNPKIVNFATALAIAKHPKTDIECELYVLGESHEKTAFETVHDVIDGLSLLSGKLDCSEGLKSYFQYANDLEEENENFLILSEASLKSVAMQKAIHENFDQLKYLITTNESGEITIYKIKNKGKKHIKTIHLSLADLWSKKTKYIAEEIIEANHELPILYPVAKNYKSVFHYNSKFYTVSRGKLFQFVDVSKGVLKIAENIRLTQGQYVMIQNSKKHLILFNLVENVLESYNIDQGVSIGKQSVYNPKSEAIFLFQEGDNAYLKLEQEYWKILEDCILQPVSESVALDGYKKELDLFKKSYYYKKDNFNVLYSTDNIWINKDRKYLDFNNYGLLDNQLLSIIENNTFLSFEAQVDLIFKNKGKQPLQVVKFLKQHLNISLSEAKNITDSNLKVILENVTEQEAEDLKYQIEDLGAICYTKVNSFKTPDGSTITCQDGIAILESSNVLIPKIYIPLIIKGMTAMATPYEFAGNDYFLPKENKLTVISVQDFHEKYINPFINIILEHET